jgi:hypothetical protein
MARQSGGSLCLIYEAELTFKNKEEHFLKFLKFWILRRKQAA